MFEILLRLIGVGLKYPLITGLLLLSLTGMTWSYYKGYSGANKEFKAAKIEAIEKDRKQNDRLRKEADELIERAQDETAKADKITTMEIENIKSIRPNQCLDVKLSDIGLQ